MIDEDVEILMQGEDEVQKAIPIYNNYDLKSLSSTATLVSASSDSASVETGTTSKAADDDEDDWQCNGRDTTEHHGTFITHDDDFLEKHVVVKTKKFGAAMMQANQCEILEEDDDGHVYGEFTGHGGGATDEVYEDYRECAFKYEEDSTSYDDEYKDYTYDASSLY